VALVADRSAPGHPRLVDLVSVPLQPKRWSCKRVRSWKITMIGPNCMISV